MKVQYNQADIQTAVNLIKELDVSWKVLNPIMVLLMTKGQEVQETVYVPPGLSTVDRILAGDKIFNQPGLTVHLADQDCLV